MHNFASQYPFVANADATERVFLINASAANTFGPHTLYKRHRRVWALDAQRRKGCCGAGSSLFWIGPRSHTGFRPCIELRASGSAMNSPPLQDHNRVAPCVAATSSSLCQLVPQTARPLDSSRPRRWISARDNIPRPRYSPTTNRTSKPAIAVFFPYPLTALAYTL